MSPRRLSLLVLLLSLGVAGGLSLLASSAPDGLERSLDEIGAEPQAVAIGALPTPLAGYQIAGDGLLGRSLAGVLGALAVLLLSLGLAHALRWLRGRREPTTHHAP